MRQSIAVHEMKSLGLILIYVMCDRETVAVLNWSSGTMATKAPLSVNTTFRPNIVTLRWGVSSLTLYDLSGNPEIIVPGLSWWMSGVLGLVYGLCIPGSSGIHSTISRGKQLDTVLTRGKKLHIFLFRSHLNRQTVW